MRWCWILVSALVAVLFSSNAHAQKRVALVIGNSAYQHTPVLANPKNDASDVGAALRKLNFTVIDGTDLDKSAFDRKVREFAAALKGAEAGVFFYAGHGLQVAGQNYLVPTDAKLTSASSLDSEMVRADVVQRIMESEASTNILFLDACRDNPLARNLAIAMGTRSASIGRGLAPVESGVGTLISFSTQPGNVALDGTGRNSPFTRALVQHVTSMNDDLSAVLITVRNDVMKATKRKQVPWEHSALTGRFYFGAGPKADLSREAAAAWQATQDTTSSQALEAFIERYSDTHYAALARARVEELRNVPSLNKVPRLKASPDHPFDGYWILKIVTASAPCNIKSGSHRVAIKQSKIYFTNNKLGGEVERGGKFKYTRPNSNFPRLRVVIAGTLGQTAGKAIYITGKCSGSYAITKEGELPVAAQ